MSMGIEFDLIAGRVQHNLDSRLGIIDDSESERTRQILTKRAFISIDLLVHSSHTVTFSSFLLLLHLLPS